MGENGKESDQGKKHRIQINVTDKDEEIFKANATAAGLSFNEYMIRAGRKELDRRYRSPKNEGMIPIRNAFENATCISCKKIIQINERILWKKTVGAICMTCSNRIDQETLSDPATLKKDIVNAGQRVDIHAGTKILQHILGLIYKCQDQLNLPEWTKLHAELVKSENDAYKLSNDLLRARGLVPDKESIRIFLEEIGKMKQTRLYAEQKIRNLVLNPITVAKITEILQTTPYYVPVEVQPPMLEEKPSGTEDDPHKGETPDVPSVEPQDTLKFNDREAAKKIKDPNNLECAKAGMDYCKAKTEWMWPDPNCCADCKKQNPSLYDECRKWNQETRQKLSSDHPEREGNP